METATTEVAESVVAEEEDVRFQVKEEVKEEDVKDEPDHYTMSDEVQDNLEAEEYEAEEHQACDDDQANPGNSDPFSGEPVKTVRVAKMMRWGLIPFYSKVIVFVYMA